ncbi:ABC transporter ATP-binding protein [Hamadaea sp. NPDC050747]|uniref:ABC transporter ATP-binding protein n=1 Tax=Hamadaea sp. NPDC050747 TaxID=3155789 RepID=UPI0033CE7CD5
MRSRPTVTGQVIAVEDVSKSYRDVLAVDRVTLTVTSGEIYALLGLNGAGKTTLIRMLLGMIRPSGGHVRVLGTRVSARSHEIWGDVGYLVETPAAYPELTVRENLDAVRRLRRIGDRGVVGAAIERLGLAEYADRRARTLSLGNTQRLGLAKALLHSPRLLILDEPANGLDPAGVVEIRQLLLDLAADGTTVFLSSHVLAEVARLATRIGIIHAGRLQEEFAAADLAGRVRRQLSIGARDVAAAAGALTTAGYTVRAEGEDLTCTDTTAVDHPEDVAVALVAAGCPPTRLVVEREDLETYFLRTVGVEHA